LSEQKEIEQLSPKQRKEKMQEELADRLRADSRRKRFTALIVLIVLLGVCAALFFFIYKPYKDAMNLIELSDQYVAAENYTDALKSLNKARIIAPYMKGLYYRAGLVQLQQMDYFGAEDMFNKELAAKGYISGAELALGFICTVDGLLVDKGIKVEMKKSLIDELSAALKIDITLKSDQVSLDLADKSGYQSAITHFARSRDSSKDFEIPASVGLAYAHGLDSNRDGGMQSYAKVANLASSMPLLSEYYNGIESKLGMGSKLIADAGTDPAISDEGEWSEDKSAVEEGAEPPIPVGDLPPIPDDLQITPLAPDGDSASRGKLPPYGHLTSSTPEPKVKPFKVTEYPGKKEGEKIFTVTLLNIKKSGKTVAREGQTRTMPNTNTEVFIVKLTPEEIIIKEDNLYTFTWKPQRNSWVWVKDEKKNRP
jgi:tetratricopeptide (TPR) repeat protein